MNFESLHENLRLEILRRIDQGILSGSTLARATGFQQAHISNFLNRRRSLSLEGLDRVLSAENLSILDLLPADAIRSLPPPGRTGSGAEIIPVVSHTAAAINARIQASEIIDIVEVPGQVLHFSRQNPLPGKEMWQRFVAIRVDGMQAAAMEPLLRQDMLAIIDRHYNSPALYRPQSPTIYAVHTPEALRLTFLELEDNNLILRPRNRQIPVRLMGLSPDRSPGHPIVGRVCYVVSEF